MAVRVVQVSDLHLCRDPAGRVHGVPVWDTFRDILRHIESHAPRCDYLIIMGDLADDGEVGTYRYLRDLLGERLARCRLVPGNQDNRDHIREVFPDIVPGEVGPLTFSFSAGDWRLIGLDTLVPGGEEGRISPAQLAWLGGQLAAHPDTSTMIFLHHPPISVLPEGESDLMEPTGFLNLIAASPQVVVVSAGHVHHAFQGSIGDTTVLTAPSSAFQYRPADDSFDDLAPGARIFDLDAGSFRTEVVRLPGLKHPPH
jgi:3',5'-cyclic AMP phosphodiesterase CpdA